MAVGSKIQEVATTTAKKPHPKGKQTETGPGWRLPVGKYVPFPDWSQALPYLHVAQPIRLERRPRGGDKGLKKWKPGLGGSTPAGVGLIFHLESVLFAASLINFPWLSSPGLSFQLFATKRQEPRKKNWPNISVQKVPANYLTKRYNKIISRGPTFQKNNNIYLIYKYIIYNI